MAMRPAKPAICWRWLPHLLRSSETSTVQDRRQLLIAFRCFCMPTHTANTTKKAPPAIEVVFRAPGLVPEKISIGQLARVLRALQRLAAGEEAKDLDDDADSAISGPPLGLVGIK